MEGVTEETSFDIWNSGTGTVSYELSWDEPWVSVSPTSGSSSGEHDPITVTIDTTGLPLGSSQECYIDITSNGGNKVFALWVIIGTTPKVEIEKYHGRIIPDKYCSHKYRHGGCGWTRMEDFVKWKWFHPPWERDVWETTDLARWRRKDDFLRYNPWAW